MMQIALRRMATSETQLARMDSYHPLNRRAGQSSFSPLPARLLRALVVKAKYQCLAVCVISESVTEIVCVIQ